MENKSSKIVDKVFRDNTKIIHGIVKFLGLLPIGIRYKSLESSSLNVYFVLIIFVYFFLKVVIWIEIFNSPHNTVTEYIRAIDLFTESFSSIVTLVTVIRRKKSIQKVWDLFIETEATYFSLELDTAYEKTKIHCKVTFICFLIVHISFFITDYFLLTQTSNHTFVLPSFLVLAIHTVHNSFCLTANCFFIHTLQQRFYMLNTALRNIKNVGVENILNDLPLIRPISHMSVLTVQQQVEKIKLAHDKYSGLCTIINELGHFGFCSQIASSIGVITANLYAVISMIMDEQYDFRIISHCLIWALYRTSNLLLLVFPLTLTANEVSESSSSSVISLINLLM